jgi:hypothetical protein
VSRRLGRQRPCKNGKDDRPERRLTGADRVIDVMDLRQDARVGRLGLRVEARNGGSGRRSVSEPTHDDRLNKGDVVAQWRRMQRRAVLLRTAVCPRRIMQRRRARMSAQLVRE